MGWTKEQRKAYDDARYTESWLRKDRLQNTARRGFVPTINSLARYGINEEELLEAFTKYLMKAADSPQLESKKEKMAHRLAFLQNQQVA